MKTTQYDVIVAGGGVAGCLAAVAAARQGAKTLLLEKSCTPGGLATAGLINIFLPLCDGNGRQVTSGLAQELLERSMKYGPGKIPADWMEKHNAAEVERLRIVFSPAGMILSLEEMMLESNVTIAYDTLLTAVKKEGALLQSVSVENCDGRSELSAKSFVDATGSGHLAKLCGEELTPGKNVLSLWALEYEGTRQYGRDRMQPEINMLTRGNAQRTFCDPSAEDVTNYMLESRAMLREFYRNEYESGNTDRFTRWPLFLAAMPQFRKIAAVKGKAELKDDMNDLFFEDSIGMVSDWRKSGPVWEIPFGTMQVLHTENLFTAGRNISSLGDAWEITRCIPCACLTGEAAGYAAFLQSRVFPEDLTGAVQSLMRGNGNKLHRKEL